MNDLAKAILRSGILDDELPEFQRWKAPSTTEPIDGDPIESAAELVQEIERALQSKELILVRATDLDVVPQYLRTQKQGQLHVETNGSSATFEVVYGLSMLDEYILPWTSDLITELLEEGEGHLVTCEGTSVYFDSVSVLFFGEQKSFLVCKPSILIDEPAVV